VSPRCRRVGLLDGIGTGVQRAVGQHPEHDSAGIRPGRCLKAGQAAEHPICRPVAGCGTGELPVAQEDDGHPRHVVCVEGALAGRVRGRMVRATSDVPVCSSALGPA